MKELIKATLTPSELRKYALKARFWDQWTQEECRLMASAYLQLWNNAVQQAFSESASPDSPTSLQGNGPGGPADAAPEEKIEQLRKDADRYRWLRGAPLRRNECFSFDGLSLKQGRDLDAAIDAARI